MRVLHQVLKRIYQDYAVFYPPVDAHEIQMVNNALVQDGLAALPQDYMNFLMMTNGLFYNGLEMFATREHEREKGAFFHRAIVQMQRFYTSNPALNGKILLAQAPEEFVLYDFKRKEYQIMDRYSYGVFLKLPNLLDVFYYYAKPTIEK